MTSPSPKRRKSEKGLFLSSLSAGLPLPWKPGLARQGFCFAAVHRLCSPNALSTHTHTHLPNVLSAHASSTATQRTKIKECCVKGFLSTKVQRTRHVDHCNAQLAFSYQQAKLVQP